MTKSNIHKALGVAALLGIALLAGCQDVSTDLKPPKYKTSIPESETRISAFQKDFPQKWVHFFGPVSGKTKVDSFIGYAAHLGLIRGGTPSGLYC